MFAQRSSPEARGETRPAGQEDSAPFGSESSPGGPVEGDEPPYRPFYDPARDPVQPHASTGAVEDNEATSSARTGPTKG